MEIVSCKVLRNENIKELIYEMELYAPEIAHKATCGQFINISTNDNAMLLKRPISICKIKENSIVITYRIVGNGTKKLSSFQIGDVVEVLGPLGNVFPLYLNMHCLLVGGGIGIPPLVELAKQLKNNGNKVTVLLAARNKDLLIYEEQFKDADVFVMTDDGSLGFKGNVIDFLNQFSLDFDILYACGPTKMLQALDNRYQGIKEGFISFEERMACGIGACYGCVCKTKTVENGYMRVCKEGPVFKLGVVDYES